MEETKVITGKGTGSKGKKLLLAGGVVLLVVVAAGAGVGVRYWQTHRHSSTPASTAQRPKTREDTAQDLALSGDYAGAQAAIENALKQPNLSADDKYQLYYQQGANQKNQGDDQAALASFLQAASYEQTQGIYESLAQVATALGKNADAISYYKKAIPLIPPSPLSDDYKRLDEQAIKALGGQP